MMNDSFVERLDRAQKRLEAACGRVHRDPSGVRIVAVAKNFGPESVAEAANAGLTVFGESRVQEAKQKIPLCPGHLEWHMVGHLQRNKARDAVEMFRMIHSVDSLRLLEAIDRASEAQGTVMPVCMEVNVSGEGSKFGLPPGEAGAVLEKAGQFMHTRIVGLMTVPPVSKNLEDIRPFFRRLRELRDRLQDTARTALPELSMGMSGDFEIAVEEGATWVRLGTALFGERPSTWRKPADTGEGSEMEAP